MQAQVSFKNLLTTYFESQNKETFLVICQDMVDSLVSRVVELEEEDTTARSLAEAVATFAALYRFCEAEPKLLVKHIGALWPQLKTAAQGVAPTAKRDSNFVLYYAAKILAKAIPLKQNINAAVLKEVEETLVNQILNATAQAVVESSVECLSGCVKVSGNVEIARDTLKMFYEYLQREDEGDHTGQFAKRKPDVLRSLFASGLLCQHFDFSSDEQKRTVGTGDDKLDPCSIRDVIYLVQLKFAQHEEVAVQLRALSGFGYFALRHPHFMLREDIKELYLSTLTSGEGPLKEQVLNNLKLCLEDEESRMAAASKVTESGEQGLVEMGGDDSGCSGVILSHLEDSIRGSVLDNRPKLRLAAFQVLKLMLKQGQSLGSLHVGFSNSTFNPWRH
jgi:hypothetical protein